MKFFFLPCPVPTLRIFFPITFISHPTKIGRCNDGPFASNPHNSSSNCLNCLVAATRATQETLGVTPNALASAFTSGSVAVYSGVLPWATNWLGLEAKGHLDEFPWTILYLLFGDEEQESSILFLERAYLTPLTPPPPRYPCPREPQGPIAMDNLPSGTPDLGHLQLVDAHCQGNCLVRTGHSLVAPCGQNPISLDDQVRVSSACSSHQTGTASCDPRHQEGTAPTVPSR